MSTLQTFPSPQRSKARSSAGDSERSGTVFSGQSRQSLLDDVPLYGSFSFKREQLERSMAAVEEQQFNKYRRKIKPISLFFVVFSVYILVNACIGWSSSPFYDKQTECHIYDMSNDCEFLKNRVTGMYFIEGFGSILLVAHGLIGMTLVEYTRNLRIIRILNAYTKVVIVFYGLCALCRTAMYIKILVLLAPLEVDKEQNFGGFLAVYAQNTTVALVITIVLLVAYVSCFMSSFYMVCVTSNLQNFAKENELQKQREAERERLSME